MLSGKMIDRGRAAVVALLVVLGVYAGCMKRADGVLSAPPASNPSAAFSLDRKDGKWWLVAPGGQGFFSMGVCVVSQGSSKEEFDPENPSYAAWQHYGNSQQWAAATVGRLNS